jgi:hypothetical protein
VFEAEAVDEKCSCRAQVRYGQAGVVGVKGFAFKGSEYLKTRQGVGVLENTDHSELAVRAFLSVPFSLFF